MPELASRAGGSPREPGLTVIHAAAGKRRRGVGVCVSVFGWGGGVGQKFQLFLIVFDSKEEEREAIDLGLSLVRALVLAPGEAL